MTRVTGQVRIPDGTWQAQRAMIRLRPMNVCPLKVACATSSVARAGPSESSLEPARVPGHISGSHGIPAGTHRTLPCPLATSRPATLDRVCANPPFYLFPCDATTWAAQKSPSHASTRPRRLPLFQHAADGSKDSSGPAQSQVANTSNTLSL